MTSNEVEKLKFGEALAGVKGSGKSVKLKSMLQDVLCLGNNVLVIDIENEYSNMAQKLAGKIVKIGSSPVINPLEIRKLYAEKLI